MKTWMTVSALLAVLTLAAYDLAWVRFEADAPITDVRLEPANARWSHATWGDESVRNRHVTCELRTDPNGGWSDFCITLKVAEAGKLRLQLLGPWKKLPNGELERIEVVFADLKVEGAELRNGSFTEVDAAGNLAGWSAHTRGENADPFRVPGGVLVWHNGFYHQALTVRKDAPVTVSGRCRKAKPEDRAARSGEANDRKFRDAPDHPLDLARAANMGFADEKEGDGKGGWSDQGKDNDMRGFPVDRSDFGGVRFRIAKSDKAVISLNLKPPAPRLNRVTVTLPEAAEARYLYLLHASCFNQTPGPLGKLRIRLADGKTVDHEIITGRDIADWWNAGQLPNGSVVYRKQNGSSSVGIYLSRFAIADEPAKVTAVELEAEGAAVWIVAGMTLSLRNAPPVAENRLVMRADDVWKPVDTAKLAVRPGSALDFGNLVEPGPAGKYGRAILTPQGGLAFEKQPEKPVRFFAFNAFANHLFTWSDSQFLDPDPEVVRARIRDFAAGVRRQGYNMVRFQGVDLWLMGRDAPGYAQFSVLNLDYFHYLLAELKKEGVYFGIDLFSYTGYEKLPNQWSDAIAKRYKERMYFDPDARKMWVDGVRQLLGVRNPYTGLTLPEEPALVYVDLHNEQELGIWIVRDPLTMGGVKPLAEKAFRDFLAKRYSDGIAKLNERWGTAYAGFDAIPLPTRNDLHSGTLKSKDANDFLYEHEKEMLDFYLTHLAETGFTGLTTFYDCLGYLRFMSIRRDLPIITMHGYHNHPSAQDVVPVNMAQGSIVSATALYLRYMGGARVWNRPFLITEYNAPAWGKYRHQEGLVLPAYSALQDYTAITAHQIAVARVPQPVAAFRLGVDPIARAGQAVAAFAYGRGDVRPSPHKVGVAFAESFMRDHRNMNRGMSSEQNRLLLLTGLGVVLDGTPGKGLPAYPRLDLLLPPGFGSEITATAWFSMPVDQGMGSDFAATLKRLRDKKILPPENRTDAGKGVFESDTGELTMWSKENRFTADTPKLQGGVSDGGRTLELRDVSFTTSLPASVTLIALEGESIPASRRLLLVFATDALNTGMELSADRATLHKVGTLPILLETGKLELTLNHPGPLKCFALAIDGERREELPVRREGKRLRLDIDTAALKTGPALYFELTE